MKLVKARVQNFKSVEDSGEFTLQEDITCLVGKNEAGKTALLTALYRTNPVFDSEFDREADYPRRYLSDFDERHPDGTALVVTTWWTLEAHELAAIETTLGPGAVTSNEVEVTRSYGKKPSTWTVKFDQSAIVKHLLNEAELHAEEREALAPAQTLSALREKIGDPAEDSPRLAALANRLDEVAPKANPYQAFWKLVELPKFMLFSQYQRMQGQVSLAELARKKANNSLDGDDQVFLALCAMAGTTVEEVAKIDRFETLVSKFEGASNKISQVIFKYWTQNRHLKVNFRHPQILYA